MHEGTLTCGYFINERRLQIHEDVAGNVLEIGEVVSQLADAINDQIDNLITDGVAVTSRIFLSGDQLLQMEQLMWCSRLNDSC